jgi:hypothetical protein
MKVGKFKKATSGETCLIFAFFQSTPVNLTAVNLISLKERYGI